MKTILVVDDEFDMTGTLRVILEGQGYRVSTCGNGREALQRLALEKPDLVLMDVMMPLMGGVETLKAMKHTAGLDRIPVVLMSAVPPAEKQEEYGWQGFLRKPFGLDDLIRTVKEFAG